MAKRGGFPGGMNMGNMNAETDGTDTERAGGICI